MRRIRARIMASGAPDSGRSVGAGLDEESEGGRTIVGFDSVEGRIGVREWCGKVFDLSFGSGWGDGDCGIGVEITARGILV